MRISIFALFLLTPSFLLADGGPKIGRPKAPCYAVIRGVEKMVDVDLYKLTDKSGRLDSTRVTDSTFRLRNNDTIPLNYDHARWWQGPLKVVAISRSTGQRLDSVTWKADEKNLIITFTGMEAGKMKYSVEETKAYYPYHLFSEDEGNTPDIAKRNKMILMALSVAGFVVLGFMFYKRQTSNKA